MSGNNSTRLRDVVSHLTERVDDLRAADARLLLSGAPQNSTRRRSSSSLSAIFTIHYSSRVSFEALAQAGSRQPGAAVAGGAEGTEGDGDGQVGEARRPRSRHDNRIARSCFAPLDVSRMGI